MALKNDYDIIIAGAGAAGLSLIWNILHTPELKNKSILLADRNLQPVRDKTWCFWDDHQSPFEQLVHHSWSTLEVRAEGNTLKENLRDYQYYCVKSDDYTENILAFVRKHPAVTLLEANIHDFGFERTKDGKKSKGYAGSENKPGYAFYQRSGDNAGYGFMESSKGRFSAAYIFQSVLKPPGLSRMKRDIALKQHFMGWHIRTGQPVFDPATATFMDFEVPRKNGVTFVYVLPFCKYEALIEYTLFSEELLPEEAYREGLEEYISGRLGLKTSEYEVVYSEKGVIPMEDRRYPARYCNRVWNTGMMGGLPKPSTGYTFTRIQRHSEEIARTLAKGNNPPSRNRSAYRFRVYDMMLLNIIQESPGIAVHIFHELFRKNRIDRIFRFLEEKTRFDQELKIFASLPWKPFFKSIYNMKHRIITGA